MTQGAYTQKKASPTALTVVILMHGVALGALALSKMDVALIDKSPIEVIDIATPKPPPPPKPPEPTRQPQPMQREIVTVTPRVIDIAPNPVEFDTRPTPNPPQPYVLPGTQDIITPPSPPPPPPPPPPATTVEPARAKANLNSYVSDADYPASAVRSEEQGTTRFRLSIGPDGRVKECSVTGSSGSSSLDAATCRIMKSRARFTPARDSTGNATGDQVASSIRWVLPE
ncbi:MAG TPA: energy transducer TonB [Allosphingosinicella sp.]|jgi:protein TonB